MAQESNDSRCPGSWTAVIPFVTALAVVGAWLAAKAVLFRHLEYVCDMFQHLIMSRSVFEGHPFLWEPQAGGLLHNYPLLPAFYLLTGWLGAYGLFVGTAVWFAAAIVAVWRLGTRAEPWRRDAYWTITYTLVLGPVAFWLWDDPLYGWHTQIVFLPLGVMFAASLIARTRLAWLAAALLVLNREEGALVAWAIHLAFELSRTTLDETRPVGTGWWRTPGTKRAFVLSLAYAVAFALNMAALLARQPHVADSRVGVTVTQAPYAMLAMPLARAHLLTSLSDAVGLLFCGVIVGFAGLQRKPMAWALALLVPLLATAAMGTMAYPVDGDAMAFHGLAWPPRFVMPWTVLVAGCYFGAAQAAPRPGRARQARLWTCVVVGLATVAAQVIMLDARRSYDVVGRLTTIARHRADLTSGVLTQVENAMLDCLGTHLPATTLVKAPPSLDGRFHRQTPLADWPESQIAICDLSPGRTWPVQVTCERSRATTSVASVVVGELWLGYAPSLARTVATCTGGGR